MSAPVSVNVVPPSTSHSSHGGAEVSTAHIGAGNFSGTTNFQMTSFSPSIGTTNLQMTPFSPSSFPQHPWSYAYGPYVPTPPSAYPMYATAPHPTTPLESSMPPRPFTLAKIAGNISVCAGCRNKYSKQGTPPDDLCIRHQEWREFVPSGSQTPQSRFGNTYYHFNPNCVWLRCPAFNPTQLEVPQDLDLDTVHKNKLLKDFGIHIP